MLPSLSLIEFERRLAVACATDDCDPDAVVALHHHYQELVRWTPTVDLIGPGAEQELFERHYAESLAALPLLPLHPFRLLDLGSGAGFPGFVLAAACREADCWLVEARAKRATFLSAVVRKSGLAARLHIVAARVDAAAPLPLPSEIAIVTSRALRLAPSAWRALLKHLAPEARLLLWSGLVAPELPSELELLEKRLLPRSRGRYLRSYRVAEAAR